MWHFQACVLAGSLQATVRELSGHYDLVEISGSESLPQKKRAMLANVDAFLALTAVPFKRK